MNQTNIDIFKYICDYIKLEEFINAQSDYLNIHCNKFEDSEENKLEYTTVHEGYIHILETLVDAKLQQKFTEDQINDFYGDFIPNFNDYKKLNEDCCDSLMEFIDFN